MRVLLILAALCQLALLLGAAFDAFVDISMPNGVLSSSSSSNVADAAIKAAIPMLLIAAAPFVLCFARQPLAWYSLLGLNALCALYGIFLNEPSGVKAIFWLPSVLALLLLLTPPLRTRFSPVVSF